MTHHWDDIAAVRRRQIEDGRDLTFSRVFVPYYQQLISGLNPSSILEVGGGTGHLARSLGGIPQRYVMLEPSQGMYEVAREVLANERVEIHNCTVETFPEYSQFDLVLSHMCVQAATDLRGFLRSIARQISATGIFLVSLPHPAFYNGYKRFFPAEKFQYMSEQSNRISFSITLEPDQLIEGVPYHHRPLSKYVSYISDAGLCLTCLEEIYPSLEIQELYGRLWENPRYLVLGGCHAQMSPLNQKLVQACYPRA